MKRFCLFFSLCLNIFPVDSAITSIEGTPFFLDNIARTWDDCNAVALSNGLELASIRNAAENKVLKNAITREHWIGAYQTDFNMEPGGSWAWTDGSDWTYSNWNPGEPNNAYSLEHHAEMKVDGKWNDVNSGLIRFCAYRNIAVEVLITVAPTTMSPTGSPTTDRIDAVITSIEGTPFFLDNIARTWDDCNAVALSNGLELASIRNAAENKVLKNAITREHWIGAYQTDFNMEPGGSWAWTDGSDWTYSNWNPGEPNNAYSLEHHAEMKVDGKWNDVNSGLIRFCAYRNTSPTSRPTFTPSETPTFNPSLSPSKYPSSSPTFNPSKKPSSNPIFASSTNPSSSPSTKPSLFLTPSVTPTLHPSFQPSSSAYPSFQPSVSFYPTISIHPSLSPSTNPSSSPSTQPSLSLTPSVTPTLHPSFQPSVSFYPTISIHPSLSPSTNPSSSPSTQPSLSLTPSVTPTLHPSFQPSVSFYPTTSIYPSLSPSANPSSSPSTQPSFSLTPSVTPTLHPSFQPSVSFYPTTPIYPSLSPSLVSTSPPTMHPSTSIIPSVNPTYSTEPSKNATLV